MISFRSYAKWRLLEANSKEIKTLIKPHLQTSHQKKYRDENFRFVACLVFKLI